MSVTTFCRHLTDTSVNVATLFVHYMHLSIHIPTHPKPSETPSDLLSTPSREYVFFEELLTGFIVLEDPQHKNYHLNLDVSIIPGDIIDNDPKFHTQHFLISSEPVTDILESTSNTSTYKFSLPVQYPRRKLNSPKIVFKAFAKQVSETTAPSQPKALPNYFPVTDQNLLQELDVTSPKTDIFLGNSVIEKKQKSVSPEAIEVHETVIESSISVPIYSALVIRLKSTKPAGKNNELLASFNIEASDQLIKLGNAVEVQLNQFELNFSGHMIDLNQKVYKFPIFFGINESVNLNFKLINGENDDQLKQLTVALELLILKKETVSTTLLSNAIQTTWSPFIDFSLVAPPISNSLKSTGNLNQPIQKKKMLANVNPSSTMVFKKSSSSTSVLPASFRRHSSNSNITVNLTNNISSGNLYGLKLTFIGKLTIKLGEIVTWRLQAINGSNNRLSLSLVSHGSNSGISSVSGPLQLPQTVTGLGYGPQSTTQPLPPSVLLQSYKSLQSDNNGILVLDTDIRIGPLDPNTVFETDLKIMGLARGIYNLDGLNIFDLATGDGLDFGKLVEVFVT